MPTLPLTPDELLSTTRSVRKRLDFSRPVEPEVIRECLELAAQAPTGGNSQLWHFVMVTDAAKRQTLGDIYRKGWELYLGQQASLGRFAIRDPDRAATQQRVLDSANYLAAHVHEAPVLLIPCIRGRTDSAPSVAQAGHWGSILPAAWSFMLAARSRGLGTAWTSFHLAREREAAGILGIPYDEVMQAALIPVAYTTGGPFRPARRQQLDTMVHWEGW